MLSEVKRDAVARLGAPMPPAARQWRPILRELNRKRDPSAHFLSEWDVKAAIRMYRLICDMLHYYSVRASNIGVMLFSGGSHNVVTLLTLHWCQSRPCSRCEEGLIGGGPHYGAYKGTSFIEAGVKSNRSFDDLLQDNHPLITRLNGQPWGDQLRWWDISPRSLTAKKAEKLRR